MKIIKMTVLYLLGLAFLLLVLAVVINRPVFDEELLPEVAAIKNVKAKIYQENNAYPAFIALSTVSGPGLQAASNTIKNYLNQKIQNSGLDYLSDVEYAELTGGDHDAHWKNLYTSCNSRIKSTCMLLLFDEMQSKGINDDRLMAQLLRYQDLISMNDFSDATQLSAFSPLPRYSLVVSLQRLFLADAYVKQSSDEFLGTVVQDMKFWRMILNKSHLLLTKMVAIVSYRTDIASLSAAIKLQHFSRPQLIQLQSKIKSLDPSEANFSKTFEYELKYGMSMFDALEDDESDGSVTSGWFDFYQLNATHNANYEYVAQPVKEVAALNSVDYYQFQKSGQAEQFERPFNWSPTDLYNPNGKIMVGYAMPAYNDYIGRIHDLVGMTHLLKLQIELALSSDDSAAQVISRSQWNNPFTNEPMSYDETAQRIAFECMDRASSCELNL